MQIDPFVLLKQDQTELISEDKKKKTKMKWQKDLHEEEWAFLLSTVPGRHEFPENLAPQW